MSEMNMTERLYRSTQEKMLGGVCGGLADYFSIDVTLMRLIVIVAAFAGGVGIPVYLVAWVIIPVNPFEQSGQSIRHNRDAGEVVKGMVSDVKDATKSINLQKPENFKNPENPENPENHKNRSKMAGVILVSLGVYFLFERFLPYWFDISRMWPLVLILIGIGIIYRGGRK